MSNFIKASLLFFISLSVAQAKSFEDTYVIGAGDKIQISVYGESDLSIDELYISNSGKFEYPYLGQLSALNKTPESLKNEIINGLKGDYLISPKVRVSVVGFRSIYVNGEVKKPGGYEYQPGLTVDKAIALAGGFTDRAAKDKVYITQSGSEEIKNKVRLSKKIMPGDIIVIEQSFF
ncbi:MULTISPECIES: polysaccharide biosynthesis/export family protein [Vibrio oreintalis group]|uniref:Polysaccharide export protein n=1 Tax=Vibrio tubiashii TaxID=29498 RepID=A0AAE5GNU7_9VIBR|nr:MULTISPECIES: polysaccharide biosynthesis/export family protein [Vibrio oreintalis group]MDC5819323.1 polysaccharide export protein [Vibrio europaeus]MDC5842292.1 polysaccharide export protein [Vibrio europaeus]MDC5855602.1 polysaccharide export protein [Vibrio europaeus]MDC5872124.1 polysaccharide export protein [Vibrio europaeus]NOH24986.1 polysaccharide export protein [Vibrio europaeus]